MGAPPAFQFYAGDWLKSTVFLSAAARGAYISMLAHAWDFGPIPDTPAALTKAMCLSLADPPVAAVWDEVRPRWKLTRKGWINKRLEHTRQEQENYRLRRSNAGRRGAAVLHERRGNALAMPLVEPCESHSPSSSSSPSPSSSTSPSGKIKPVVQRAHAAVEPDGFAAFWKRYPNRKGRQAALKVWVRLSPAPDLVARFDAALDWQRQQPQWTRDRGQYVPMLATWLNQSRWEDEPFEPVNQSDPNAGAWDRLEAKVANGKH